MRRWGDEETRISPLRKDPTALLMRGSSLCSIRPISNLSLPVKIPPCTISLFFFSSRLFLTPFSFSFTSLVIYSLSLLAFLNCFFLQMSLSFPFSAPYCVLFSSFSCHFISFVYYFHHFFPFPSSTLLFILCIHYIVSFNFLLTLFLSALFLFLSTDWAFSLVLIQI